MNIFSIFSIMFTSVENEHILNFFKLRPKICTTSQLIQRFPTHLQIRRNYASCTCRKNSCPSLPTHAGIFYHVFHFFRHICILQEYLNGCRNIPTRFPEFPTYNCKVCSKHPQKNKVVYSLAQYIFYLTKPSQHYYHASTVSCSSN